VKGEQSLSDLSVVAFRTSDRRLVPPSGDAFVIDSGACFLILSQIEEKGTFETRAGPIQVEMESITRLETPKDAPDQQALYLADGRRLTGKFTGKPVSAVVAATGTPLQIDFSKIRHATMDSISLVQEDVAGLSLQGVVAGADRDIVRIARLADKDPKAAKDKLDPYLTPERFKTLSTTTKEQVTILEAIIALRLGDFETTEKTLRKCAKATDPNIAAYALATQAVLKKYSREFEGKPLSDRAVFAQAGLRLAEDHIKSVREYLRDRLKMEGSSKGEYRQAISNVKKYEEQMQVAAVLAGPDADDELLRLWTFAMESCQRELGRLDQEIKEKESRGSGYRGSQREVQELKTEREKVLETGWDFAWKKFRYGFHIEDPDIEEQREGRGGSADDEP
jgi:hypothetical protein